MMKNTMNNETINVYQVVVSNPENYTNPNDFTVYIAAKDTDSIGEILKNHFRAFIEIISIERLCDHLIVPEDWEL